MLHVRALNETKKKLQIQPQYAKNIFNSTEISCVKSKLKFPCRYKMLFSKKKNDFSKCFPVVYMYYLKRIKIGQTHIFLT